MNARQEAKTQSISAQLESLERDMWVLADQFQAATSKLYYLRRQLQEKTPVLNLADKRQASE